MSQKQGNLHGLLRLRGVRERDSRIGLSAAFTEERNAAGKVAELEQLLATVPSPVTSDLAAFQSRQGTIELIRHALTEAHRGLETSRQVTTAARDRWLSDHSRLAAVESLVERRAAAAQAERRRRENRELDEIAQESWRRRTPTVVAGGAR